MKENVSKVFDSEQSKVVIDLEQRLTAVEKQSLDSPFADRQETRPAYLKDKSRLRKFTEIWKKNGQIDGLKDGRITIQDLIEQDSKFGKEMKDSFSTDHPLLIPRVISEVTKEAIEPNVVLTPMLQKINYQHGTQLTFPAIGAIAAADIPEGGEYPERSLDFAGQVVATIGKSGVAVKFSEEMIRYSLYDVMSMHLRAAGRALIRWKEKKVADMIISNAGGTNTLFDNTSTSYSGTTGRGAGGSYNGTITLNDFFKAYATMVNRGFIPDTLIMNPFAWQIFADEGLQRIFGFWNGAGMWNTMQGSPGNAPQWKNGGMNGLLQNTTVSSPENVATTFTNVPSIFPYPFRIVVSPFMPYDATQNITDMILCDSSQLGVLVVDEEVQTDQWNDPARDIMKIKLRERYGLGSLNNGKGSGIIKGVYLGQSYDFAHNTVVTFNPNTDLSGANSLTGDAGKTGGQFTSGY